MVSVAVSSEMPLVGQLVNAMPQSNGQNHKRGWLLLAAASAGRNTEAALDFSLFFGSNHDQKNKRMYGFPKRL